MIAPNGEAVSYSYDPVGNFTGIRRITDRPALLSFFPKEGIEADRVTFFGVGFGARPEDNQIVFAADKTARVVSVSPTELIAEVPPGTITGPVKITTPAGTVTTSPEPFVILPPLSVMPDTAVVRLGEAKAFTARVRLSGDRSVRWSVNGTLGGNATFGSVTPSGLYLAPPTAPPAPVVIRATSVERPELFAEARPVVGRLDVDPPELIVEPGLTGRFASNLVLVPGDRSVRWSVNGVPGGNAELGTVSPTGTYTAPTEFPSVTITVRAESVAASALFDEARVRIGSVLVSPPTAIVRASGTQQFTAVVPGGIGDTSVRWSVNGLDGGNARIGTISNSGLYMAPTALTDEPIVVRATSAAAPAVFGEGRILLGSLDIRPTSVLLPPGGSQLFTPTLSLGGNNRALKWFVNGIENGDPNVGRVNVFSDSAQYFAPRAVPPGPITVRVASAAAPALFAEASIVIGEISLTPREVFLGNGGSQKFTAVLNVNVPDKQIRWSVNGVEGGNSTAGTITADGTYRAPSVAPGQFVTVEAASAAAPQLRTSADVRFVNQIQVIPSSVTVIPGQTVSFAAQVGPTPDQVVWTTTAGTISGSGVYTAPAVAPPGPAIVRATSVKVPSVSGTAQVNFSGVGVSVQVNPSGATVAPNGTQQFTATVFPLTTSQAVTWAVVSGGGSITPSGLFTAPSTDGVTVTIRATSVAVPSAFGTATVQVQDVPQSRTKQ